MRVRLKSLAAALLLSAVAALGADQSPNVLFITIDTLRADHLSSWGYHLETSPNIDRLADEGVRFAKAYTVTSRTSPSHMSMFTSRYPQEHGAKLNGFAPPADMRFLYLPQILKNFGYKNGAFVSAWPLSKKLTGLDRFFDVYDQDLSRSYQTINSMRWAEDVAPRAMAWMEKQKGQGPFFCWVHFFDPHSPYDFREDFEPTKTTGRPDLTQQRGQGAVLDAVKAYNSEILYTDHWVGKLIERVDELGLTDETIVVVVSDHGESLGERDYQGHSRRLWESIVHVPLIIRYPGKVEAGRVVEATVTTLDVMPTLLDLTVKQTKPDAPIPTEMVGRSLAAALLNGEEIPSRQARAVAFAGQKWMMPKWLSKLWLRDLDFPLRMSYLNGDHKVIWTPENEEMEIYDLSADPYEMKPATPDDGDRSYKREEEALTKWFKSTHLAEEGENRMDSSDCEALKSLGYIQGGSCSDD